MSNVIPIPLSSHFIQDLDLHREFLSLRNDYMTLKEEMNQALITLDKVRKGTYANIGSLKKEIDPVKHELSTLKEAMARYKP